ncbi:alpha/beta fold hydrolase [Caloramator sp. mosi_1]|nr:alpha/beta fold hydrolase [Caloramator sp. mosi_1]WDC85684.1 alpha/beta fold hydrolase [Caloramator sp. mosi_1]
MKSPYGYELNALYFEVPNSKKAVIICHGITYTLYGSVKYIDLFLNRGISVLIYDHRNHGLSGGKNTTFGHYEKYDLKTVSDWLFQKLGYGGKVGIMGESMGAATVLLNSGIDDRISFYIADCPYSSMSDILKHRMRKDFHLHPFPLYYSASLITKIRAGIFLGKYLQLELLKMLKHLYFSFTEKMTIMFHIR